VPSRIMRYNSAQFYEQFLESAQLTDCEDGRFRNDLAFSVSNGA